MGIEIVEILGQIPFFQVLEQQELNTLAQKVYQRKVSAQQLIFLEGEPAEGIFFLEYGCVKGFKSGLNNGRQQIVKYFRAGDTFNEIALIEGKKNPVSAEALEESGAWVIPISALDKLITTNPKFSYFLIDQLTDRIQTLIGQIGNLSMKTVQQRLVQYLLECSIDGVVERPRWQTQAEMAAFLGTVPDVVQRELSRLQKDQLIEVNRRKIIVRDETALRQLV